MITLQILLDLWLFDLVSCDLLVHLELVLLQRLGSCSNLLRHEVVVSIRHIFVHFVEFSYEKRILGWFLLVLSAFFLGLLHLFFLLLGLFFVVFLTPDLVDCLICFLPYSLLRLRQDWLGKQFAGLLFPGLLLCFKVRFNRLEHVVLWQIVLDEACENLFKVFLVVSYAGETVPQFF